MNRQNLFLYSSVFTLHLNSQLDTRRYDFTWDEFARSEANCAFGSDWRLSGDASGSEFKTSRHSSNAIISHYGYKLLEIHTYYAFANGNSITLPMKRIESERANERANERSEMSPANANDWALWAVAIEQMDKRADWRASRWRSDQMDKQADWRAIRWTSEQIDEGADEGAIRWTSKQIDERSVWRASRLTSEQMDEEADERAIRWTSEQIDEPCGPLRFDIKQFLSLACISTNSAFSMTKIKTR